MVLRAVDRFWMEVFSSRLGRAERSIANELIDVRNRLAHNVPFYLNAAFRNWRFVRPPSDRPLDRALGALEWEVAAMLGVARARLDAGTEGTACVFRRLAASPRLGSWLEHLITVILGAPCRRQWSRW